LSVYETDENTKKEQLHFRKISAVSKVNFASTQNQVQILKAICLTNPAPNSARNIKISLTCLPPVIRDRTWAIEELASEQDLDLRDLRPRNW